MVRLRLSTRLLTAELIMQRLLSVLLVIIAVTATPAFASVASSTPVSHRPPVEIATVAIVAPRRWRRKALADYWDVSERTVDRMRKDGRLGEPKYVGKRTPTWSDEQRQAAERAQPEQAGA
jgi:hypothetical protein